MEISFFDSDYFIVGYYILTVGASLLLIKDTKKRVRNLKIGRNSIKYAPISFGILVAYVLFVFPYVDEIPILNWSWLGYNIAFGPFAEEGMWGILPFMPLLLYMFLHINYFEERYFRKSKKNGHSLGTYSHSHGNKSTHGTGSNSDWICFQICV